MPSTLFAPSEGAYVTAVDTSAGAGAYSASGHFELQALPTSGNTFVIHGLYGSFVGFWVGVNSAGRIVFYDFNFGTLFTASVSTLVPGVKYHLHVRKPTGFTSLSIYLNCSTTAEFTSASGVAIPDDPNDAMLLFANDGGAIFSNVKLSGWKAWQADRPASAASEESNSYALASTTGAIGEWHFDDGDLTDSYSNGYDLTAIGTPSAGGLSYIDVPHVVGFRAAYGVTPSANTVDVTPLGGTGAGHILVAHCSGDANTISAFTSPDFTAPEFLQESSSVGILVRELVGAPGTYTFTAVGNNGQPFKVYLFTVDPAGFDLAAHLTGLSGPSNSTTHATEAITPGTADRRVLLSTWTDDSAHSVSTPPSGMRAAAVASVDNNMSVAPYFELDPTGSPIQKTLVWSGVEEQYAVTDLLEFTEPVLGPFWPEDTFTDTNGTLLSAHEGESGVTWEAHPNWADSIEIQSNEAIYDGVGGSTLVINSEDLPAGDDYDITVPINVIVPSSTNSHGIVFKYSPTEDDGYLVRYNGGSFDAFRIDDGSASLLDGWASGELSSGAHTVVIKVRGTSFTIDVDGTERLSATDAAYNHRRVGFRVFGQEVSFASILVEPFEGGEEPEAKSGSDTGSLSGETSSLSVARPAADVGSLADSAVMAAGYAVSDSGAGVDAATLAVGVAGADAGTGLDLASLGVARTASDSGTLTESAVVDTADQKAGSDSGSFSDSAVVAVGLVASDSGVLNDVAAISAAVSAADAGSGQDAVLLGANIPVQDSGTLTETAQSGLGGGVADGGTLTEAASVSVVLTASDIGTGLDIASLGVHVSGSDSGVLTEVGDGGEYEAPVPLDIVQLTSRVFPAVELEARIYTAVELEAEI